MYKFTILLWLLVAATQVQAQSVYISADHKTFYNGTSIHKDVDGSLILTVAHGSTSKSQFLINGEYPAIEVQRDEATDLLLLATNQPIAAVKIARAPPIRNQQLRAFVWITRKKKKTLNFLFQADTKVVWDGYRFQPFRQRVPTGYSGSGLFSSDGLVGVIQRSDLGFVPNPRGYYIELAQIHRFLAVKPTTLYFTAKWCAPCKLMRPIAEQFSQVDIIDIDQHPELAKRYKITQVPTFINTQTGERRSGTMTKDELARFVNSSKPTPTPTPEPEPEPEPRPRPRPRPLVQEPTPRPIEPRPLVQEPEPAAPEPEPKSVSSRWLTVAKYVLMPEAAIPLTVGLSILGWFWRRKKSGPGGPDRSDPFWETLPTGAQVRYAKGYSGPTPERFPTPRPPPDRPTPPSV